MVLRILDFQCTVLVGYISLTTTQNTYEVKSSADCEHDDHGLRILGLLPHFINDGLLVYSAC